MSAPSDIFQRLEALGKTALEEVQKATDSATLEALRVSYMGKKGKISEVLQGLGALAPADRPKVGAEANRWKKEIEEALGAKKVQFEESELNERIQKERIDVSLPSRRAHGGSLHPLTETRRAIVGAFRRLGFEVVTGPEVETDYLCFDAANIPADHPARDMQDTFFLGPGVVLRTHTTPVQMRTMLERKPPVRILCPGAVYRSDNDATHSPMFHQIEGLWVDEKVRMSDLVGTLDFFAKEIFGKNSRVRLRPSYFPFVEPGAEVDVSCQLCGGKKPDCRVCKGTGWLEILGAGMVHPRLFELAGYEAGKFSGFAFGIGIERIAMLLHGVPDLRMFFQNDVRFLGQF